LNQDLDPEICYQLTCSFYGKAAILLAKHFLESWPKFFEHGHKV